MATMRFALLVVLVAAAAALPGNYAPAEPSFTKGSADALDRVIGEQPDTEVLLAPSAASKNAATDQFKDDPLANESFSESFVNAFKSLASKTKKFFSGKDAAPNGEMMPPVMLDEENPASASTAYKFKKPSEPISKGFEHVLDNTEDVVKHEAATGVAPVGQAQKDAEKTGSTIAAKAAPPPPPAPAAPAPAPGSPAPAPGTPATPQTAPSAPAVAAKAAVAPKLSSAHVAVKTKESSASAGCGVTFVTVGLAAMTVLAGSM